MDSLVEHDLTPLVFDEEYITGIAVSCLRLGKKDFPVHLAVDTGMGRIGCLPEESAYYAKMYVKFSTLTNLNAYLYDNDLNLIGTGMHLYGSSGEVSDFSRSCPPVGKI